MYVACSTLCFSRLPLREALAKISELRFHKIDLAVHEGGPHFKPSEVAADVQRAAQVLRAATALGVAAVHTVIETADAATFEAHLRAVCRLARLLTAPVVTLPAAPTGTDFEAEVVRLQHLAVAAKAEGVLLCAETHHQTLTADPRAAVELCRRVRGLALCYDPSHYMAQPAYAGKLHDEIYPYVRHVRLRDTGPKPGEFQVRVGQGDIEYGRIVNQLALQRYDRALTVDVRDEPPPPYPMDAEVRKLKYLLESLV